MPKVSICVPTYNNCAEVAQLMRSIGEQTFSDYEVIITDDSDGNEISMPTGKGQIYGRNSRSM